MRRVWLCFDVVLPLQFTANNCLRVMLEKLGIDSLPVKMAVCQFVGDEAVSGRHSTRQLHISFLNLAVQVVAIFIPD